jgi:hypothetical protein
MTCRSDLLRNAAPRIELVGPEAKVVTGNERQASALKILVSVLGLVLRF